MKLYLIRHGRQSSRLCNVDVDLCEEGIRQAELLGRRLQSCSIDFICSSDYIRAVQTAEVVNQFLGLEHVINPKLREISFGDMEGMTDADIAVRYADFKKRMALMTEDIPYPGGENTADVVRRTLPVMEELAYSGHKNVAVITHGGVIRSLVTHWLGMDYSRARLIGNTMENTGITQVDFHADRGIFTLERLNDYAHIENYPKLLRSSWVQAEN